MIKNIYHLMFVIFVGLTAFSLRSQSTCGFDEIMRSHQQTYGTAYSSAIQAHVARIQELRSHRPAERYEKRLRKQKYVPGTGVFQLSTGLAGNPPRFMIPVAVHVFYDPAHSTVGTGTNISNTLISDQIQILNQLYEPWGIQFCLALTTRHSDAGINHQVDKQAQVNSLSAVVYSDPSKYMNVYVVKTILDSTGVASTFTGYNNAFPGMTLKDMIVVKTEFFGNYQSCSTCGFDPRARGKVLVHEVGHYLGLWHTFQGGCFGGTTTSDCGNKGDYCCDTRPHKLQPFGTPCDTTRNTCFENYGGGDKNDPESNYMNYRDEDCLDRFTPDQYDIMLATLRGPRRNLTDPVNVNGLALSCPFHSAYFTVDKPLLCNSDTVSFAAYALSGALYQWQIRSDSANYTGSFDTIYTLSYPVVKLGTYRVTLKVVYAGDTLVLTDSNAVEYLNCGQRLASEQGNWYFGRYGGLNFNTIRPTMDPGPYLNSIPVNIDVSEGSISQSDANGKLLFYGAGEPDVNYMAGIFRVYRDDYTEMPHSPIIGDYSSVQSGIVVQHPLQNGKYFLITVSGGDAIGSGAPANDRRGLRYSLIDTVLDDIDTANMNVPVRINLPAYEFSLRDTAVITGEMITAVPMCNGRDYWILVGGGVNTGYRWDHLLIFKLDSSGIHYHGYKDSIFTKANGISAVKASPDGLFIAGENFIADFDRSTGVISNVRQKTSAIYGLSFSPNSKFLYQTEGSDLVQYNILASNLNKSKMKVYRFTQAPQTEYIYQLGPDNKIYLSLEGRDYLAVINQPDKQCSNLHPNSCDFEYQGPAIGKNGIGGVCRSGLPNMIDAKKVSDVGLHIVVQHISCDTIKFIPAGTCSYIYFWDFGDGNFSSDARPVHTYALAGTYNVMLYTDVDTVSIVVYAGLEPPVIYGDTIRHCDTSNYQVYGCGNRNEYYNYSWSVQNGIMVYQDNNSIEAYVRWKSQGMLKLQVTDPLTGCTAIDSLLVDSNGIFSNSIVVDTSDCDDITGSLPNATGSYIYVWERSNNGINGWTTIAGEKGRHLLNPVYFDTTYIRRKISGNKCLGTSYSNVLKMLPSFSNTITAQPDSFCPLSTLEVNGSAPCSNNKNISYRWQYRIGNVGAFDDLNSYYAGLQNLSLNNWNTTCWIRRRAASAGDTCYSDSVKIKVTELINKIFMYYPSYPTVEFDTAYTCSGVAAPYIGGTTPCTHNNWVFQWQSATNINGPWTDISGVNSYLLNTPAVSQTTYFRRRAIRIYSTDTSYSNIFTVDMKQSSIVSHPASNAVTEGADAVFVVKTQNMIVVAWQRALPGGAFANLDSLPHDTLRFRTESCMSQYRYRALLENACTHAQSYSDEATLTVNKLAYDLWARDERGDNGSEPSTVSFIWNSPDIWNTQQQDRTGTTHENPEYRVSAPNFIHAVVRNKGSVTSLPARLYLYWTFASTGEAWDKNWLHDFNQSQANGNWKWFNSQQHALGGLIGVYDIPAIAAADSWRLDTSWIVPHPGVISGNISDTSAAICFLGRIVTCTDAPYGMRTAETSSIGNNVKNNNNIITKNFFVKNLKPGNGRIAYIGNGNPSDESVAGKLVLHPQHCSYFDHAYVLVHLDETFRNVWYNSGASGSGFAIINDSTLLMDSCTDLVLDNIAYQAWDQSWLGIEFVMREDPGDIEAEGLYTEFDLQQYNAGSTVSAGAVLFGITLQEEPLPGGKPGNTTAGEHYDMNTPGFHIYPNPLAETLYIDYWLKQKSNVCIRLYDQCGRLLETITEHEALDPGVYKMKFSCSGLSAGVYFVEYTGNGFSQTRKIVRLK